MKQVLILPAFLILLASCGSKKQSVKTQTALKTAEPKKEMALQETRKTTCTDLLQYDEKPEDTSLFRPNIIKSSVRNHCLKVVYGYSGCSKKEAALAWNKEVEEGTFPTVNLFLTTEDPGLCEAYFTDSLETDLSKLSSVGTKVLLRINKSEKQLPMVAF